MKKIIILLTLIITAIAQNSAHAQLHYLTSLLKPTQSYCHKMPTSIDMFGGYKWQHGFTIGSTTGPYKPGFAIYKLGGKYDTIKFVIGLCSDSYRGAPLVVTIYADGKKIFDKAIKYYDIHQRVTLDIKGADELKFVLVTGEGTIGFGEVTLWKNGERPKDTGNLISGKPTKKMLCRDLMPYTMDNNEALRDAGHFLVSPTAKYKKVKVGNNEYNYGLLLMMEMALIGNNEAQTHFNLNGQYQTLSFIAGPANSGNASNGKGWITIKGDGKILHEYEINQDDIGRRITVDVSGVSQLSVFSEQESQSLYGAIVDAWVYPAGESPAATTAEGSIESEVDPRLKKLPNVCKLISNIQPYSLRSSVEHQLYSGESDYITFSMGGVKFSEGFVLYRKANFMDDNVVSYAAFDVGKEFDYVSFTVGYVGKSWVMNNDVLRVYADDNLIYETPLIATAPNRDVVIPINKCRKLRFENGGQTTMNVGAFGVADIVVYRGKPVDNTLFVHPKPQCPDEIDLIDLCKPYLHYVSTQKSNILHDGTTQRKYFEMSDGKRINKGFLLQTSTHFSLDHGVLAGKEGAGATAAIGATAVGASFVASGAAVGGALVGSTLAGVAPLLVLAAGGEAVENSCIAFNTYGEYNSLTFTVACYKTAGETQLLGPDYGQEGRNDYKETLLIAADQTIMAELSVFEAMEPQTITVPINACHQLMFWLANTNGNSAKFVFYNLRLSKSKCQAYIPEDARSTQAVVSVMALSHKDTEGAFWPRQKTTGVKEIDNYYRDLSIASEKAEKYLKGMIPGYDICTYYLETDAGQTCKAVKLRYKKEVCDDSGSILPASPNYISIINDGYYSITKLHSYCAQEIADLKKLKSDIANVKISQASAYVGLTSLGFGAIGQGKIMKKSSSALGKLSKIVDLLYQDKLSEFAFLDALINNAIDIDGRNSTEKTIFCPLFKDETAPAGDKMKVRNFNL